MKYINQVKMEFPAKSANEGFARAAAACFAAQLDPSLDELADIKTAVSEAVTNSIVHAYPDSIGTVMLRLRRDDEGTLEITVRDRGRGIPDIGQAMTPMYTTGGDDRTGMGFTIMQSFSDKVTVSSKVGKGTTVRLRKKIRGKL